MARYGGNKILASTVERIEDEKLMKTEQKNQPDRGRNIWIKNVAGEEGRALRDFPDAILPCIRSSHLARKTFHNCTYALCVQL